MKESWRIDVNDRTFLLTLVSEEDNVYRVDEFFSNGTGVVLNKTFSPECYVAKDNEMDEAKMSMWFTRWLDLYEGKVKEFTVFIGKAEYHLEGFYNNDDCVWEFYVFEITRYNTGEKMCTRSVSKTTFVPKFVPAGNTNDDISMSEEDTLKEELNEWLFGEILEETKEELNETSYVWVLATLTVDKNYTTLSRKEEYFANEEDAVQAWKGSMNTILDVLGKENFMQVGDAVTEYSYYRRYGYKANRDLEFVFDLKKQDIK